MAGEIIPSFEEKYDLTPFHFFLRTYLKPKVDANKPYGNAEIKNEIRLVIPQIISLREPKMGNLFSMP